MVLRCVSGVAHEGSRRFRMSDGQGLAIGPVLDEGRASQMLQRAGSWEPLPNTFEPAVPLGPMGPSLALRASLLALADAALREDPLPRLARYLPESLEDLQDAIHGAARGLPG